MDDVVLVEELVRSFSDTDIDPCFIAPAVTF